MADIEHAQIVIIGGGVIGLGIAFHLAEMGVTDVVLVERNTLTSGTSWHAAGIVGPLRSSLNLTRLASYATELFPELAARTGQDSGYRRTGGLWLARTQARLIELRRIAATGEISGLDARMIGPEEACEKAGLLSEEGLAGALWVADDGQANPIDICMAYAKRARGAGIRLLEGTACTGFQRRNGAVTGIELATGGRISCEKIVLCAGAWSHALGRLAGVPVPLQPVEHMYVVTEPVPGLPQPFPILRDLDRGIYLKEDSGKLVLGGFEPHAKIWDPTGPDGDRPFLEFGEDWEQFAPFMEAGLSLVPALGQVGIRHFMNGPESFTPDTRPLMGESPFLKGFFVAAGFNSTGMMSSAGVGRAMAEWLVDGRPSLDLWALDIARFDRASAAPSYLHARMEESVADLFEMHWPYKQQKAGRDARRSPFHRQFAEAGAVFGAPTGWERPLWYARHPGEEVIDYGFGSQTWWPAAAREARHMSETVALFELSPFTKIDVKGPDAAALLQYLCTNDVARDVGRAFYTQMLNDAGGIEADVTVTRCGEDAFRIVSGAATRQKDLAWLERHAAGRSVQIFDATSAEAVLGVMGPRSRDLLQSLTDADLSATAFPFGTSQVIDIGYASLRATRVSFVGELGWELYVPAEFAESLLQVIIEAGKPYDLGLAGHYALDGCRLEKGYRHWGHDIGPLDTPLESGLSFAIAWTKPDGFLGLPALEAQRRQGLARRLMLFAVDGATPLLLHDEPVYREGVYCGLTTSGGQGFRTGLSLCLAYVAVPPEAASETMFEATYQIKVAGEVLPLRPLRQPPYDPGGQRLRG